MNNIKKLLLITLISSVAIFSSCGDDDDAATIQCLECSSQGIVLPDFTQCVGDVDDGVTVTKLMLDLVKELVEDEDVTCVYVDKD